MNTNFYDLVIYKLYIHICERNRRCNFYVSSCILSYVPSYHRVSRYWPAASRLIFGKRERGSERERERERKKEKACVCICVSLAVWAVRLANKMSINLPRVCVSTFCPPLGNLAIICPTRTQFIRDISFLDFSRTFRINWFDGDSIRNSEKWESSELLALSFSSFYWEKKLAERRKYMILLNLSVITLCALGIIEIRYVKISWKKSLRRIFMYLFFSSSSSFL